MKMTVLIQTGNFLAFHIVIAFVIGVLLFIGGVIYLIAKKGLKEEHFAVAAAFEFFSSWIMYIPQELYNDIPDSIPGLKVLEGVFTALLRTFNIYLGNGYERMAFKGYPVFSSIYDIVMVLANIALLLFVVGFIAKFLNGPFQRVKLSLRKRRYTYVFSVTNEKSLSIAESIAKIRDTEKRKLNIVFSNSNKDLKEDQKKEIDSFGGIYVDLSILDIFKKFKSKTKGIEVFLFGNEEQDNLSELEKIIEKVDVFRRENIRVYIELSETPWSLYDGFLKKTSEEQKNETGTDDGIIFNFVRSEENFAYNNLLKNSIFENAINTGEFKQIKILLVGMNERNLEMLKAILFLGQMPGYRLNVMIIDEGCNKKMLEQKIPEIMIDEEYNRDGNAIYSIKYYENVNSSSAQFEDIIKNQYRDFTFAFINIGDDLQNVNIGMRARSVCYRENRKDGYIIQINIKNENIIKEWNKDLLDNLAFVGSLKTTYNYKYITMSDIEKGTVEIHKVRYPKGIPTWISYCNNEYNRHSVYARTLSFKYKVAIINKLYDDKKSKDIISKVNYSIDFDNTNTTRVKRIFAKYNEKNIDFKRPDSTRLAYNRYNILNIVIKSDFWRKYEHMRWNTYTRTMGYVLAQDSVLNDGKLDKKIRAIAKVHNDLVDFDRLPEAEKKKDALELTPEIVRILESI
ncbi:MAG: hypothetical protein K6E47_03685 [Lachnospiraceae bacterium]|nr:hypothetical protein [Lachnospiraceae bacterium]